MRLSGAALLRRLSHDQLPVPPIRIQTALRAGEGCGATGPFRPARLGAPYQEVFGTLPEKPDRG
jgi:hypothetical protein